MLESILGLQEEAPGEDMPEEELIPESGPMIEETQPRSISLRLAQAIVNSTK